MSNDRPTALAGMRAQAVASQRVDRTDWTDEQWIEDAHRLMNHVDGSIMSLVNGHVMALLRWHALTDGLRVTITGVKDGPTHVRVERKGVLLVDGDLEGPKR